MISSNTPRVLSVITLASRKSIMLLLLLGTPTVPWLSRTLGVPGEWRGTSIPLEVTMVAKSMTMVLHHIGTTLDAQITILTTFQLKMKIATEPMLMAVLLVLSDAPMGHADTGTCADIKNAVVHVEKKLTELTRPRSHHSCSALHKICLANVMLILYSWVCVSLHWWTIFYFLNAVLIFTSDSG